MSKTFIGGAVCREFESDAPVSRNRFTGDVTISAGGRRTDGGEFDKICHFLIVSSKCNCCANNELLVLYVLIIILYARSTRIRPKSITPVSP